MSSKKAKSAEFDPFAEDAPGKVKKEKKEAPSSKEKLQQKLESKKEIQRKMNRKEGQVGWQKKAGGICAVLFMCGMGLFQFLEAVFTFVRGNGVEVVEVTDTARVKTVLFSGEPWLVYCVNNETEFQKLPRVLEESARLLWSSIGVKTGVLKCWDPTESGRSVAQRFKLNLKPPLSFVVANGNKPRALNMAGVSKPEDFEKKIKPALELKASRIDALKKWPDHCTSRKTCIVIGHKYTAQRDYALGIFKPLLEKYRTSRVVSVDTSFWQLKLGEAVMKTRASTGKKGKAAEVLCLSREEGGAAKQDGAKEKGKGAKAKNGTHSGMFLQELEYHAADAFMAACQAREGVVKLEIPPKIQARPSKPKKVVVPPSPRPSPPPPSKPKVPKKSKQDHVGSRETLESEEALFEYVEDEGSDEEEGSEEGGEDEEGSESGEEEEEEDEEEGSDDAVEL